MTYIMDEDELAGQDIWDKIRPRRNPMVPLPVSPDQAVYAMGGPPPAQGAVRPRGPVPSTRPRVQAQPPMIDDSNRPPPPEIPPHEGKRDWWMNKKAPPQWQRGGPQRPPERWTGQDKSLNPHDDPREQRRLLQGAYQAGRNGDAGAQDGFPPTPFGRRLRAEYERGRRDAARGASR